MRSQITVLALLCSATAGCGPVQQARMRPYELKELHCLRQYRTGDIQTAKQALLDYLRLVEEEQASGLPFTKTAGTKALTAARLSVIYRQLGESELANQYLQKAVVYAKQDAREEGDKALLGKTGEQIGTSILELVNKLDEKNTHPKWRVN